MRWPPVTAAAAALTAVTTLASVTMAGCGGGPTTAAPSTAAPTTPAAEPCQAAVDLVTARAGAAITRIRSLTVDTDVTPLDLTDADLATTGAAIALTDLQKTAEWQQAIGPCRADATRHTQVALLPLTIGLAAQRLAEADEAGRLTKELRRALEAAVELIDTGLHGDADTTS
ncbi:hypothetical protein F5972_08660 [Microbispora cellulosiformans]|uniref:Uncharacterized protein n=1 Tax=Microbispora cellulosiformans TaxID=2614688 RepID=A0A5J5K5F8_9ACTN|nr:hypothetical protein [Microbispora cellulosiformans]KAA9379712.1 hypothetical protein F5972_08660 [Microbispora cellulosiformans]